MTLRTTLLTLAAATTMLGLSAVAAFAGSATMKHDARVYEHPGWGYTGDTADEDDDVWVKGCTNGYCYIKDDGTDGWVKAWAIDFSSDYGDGWDHHHHHHGGYGYGGVCIGGPGGGFCVHS